MEFHIPCDPDDIARYVLCPGDQARARRIAERLDGARLVVDNRGYLVFSGSHHDIPVTVCGTGMGGPVVAIAVEELAHMGADTFIRVGSCGVLQEGHGPGDVIIANGAVRGGGTGDAYLPGEHPAVPTFEVLRALVESAEGLGVPHTVGVTASNDAFYSTRDADWRNILINAGVVALEMESDTLFVLGAVRRLRTGALFASDGSPTEIKPAWGEEAFRSGEDAAIGIALAAVARLAETDNGSASPGP